MATLDICFNTSMGLAQLPNSEAEYLDGRLMSGCIIEHESDYVSLWDMGQAKSRMYLNKVVSCEM